MIYLLLKSSLSVKFFKQLKTFIFNENNLLYYADSLDCKSVDKDLAVITDTIDKNFATNLPVKGAFIKLKLSLNCFACLINLINFMNLAKYENLKEIKQA
jgi:hypothetical protein